MGCFAFSVPVLDEVSKAIMARVTARPRVARVVTDNLGGGNGTKCGENVTRVDDFTV